MGEAAVTSPGWVVSVNVGRVATLARGDVSVRTAIAKEPVEGRVAAHREGLDGDHQANRKVHGGPDKAVYAYAVEDYAWWEGELGRGMTPGLFGENLTLVGVDVSGAVVGERWAIGTAVLEVAQPRRPCGKLALRMGDPGFPARFTAAGRPGAYLRVLTEGDIGSGDEVHVLARPGDAPTVAQLAAPDAPRRA